MKYLHGQGTVRVWQKDDEAPPEATPIPADPDGAYRFTCDGISCASYDGGHTWFLTYQALGVTIDPTTCPPQG